jgi:signal transduction histidine kinase
VMMRGGREPRTIAINAARIALKSGDRYIYSFYDLTDLRRVEEQLRASNEQMRQLYMRLAHVEDDERRTLHAELHDQIGANLSALRIEIDVAASLLARDDAEGAGRHMASARDVAAETMTVARGVMAALRPPALDDYGLVAALRTFAAAQGPRLNLSIQVSGGDLLPRPAALVESSLFRIAHEAVVNAARHASAAQVSVDVADRDGLVVLTITDDGIGFDPDAPGTRPDHWGLRSMYERAQAIGGTLRVISSPGAGTRIMAEVPRESA